MRISDWSSVVCSSDLQGIPSSGSAVPTLFLAVAAMIFVAAILFGRESAVEKRLSLGGLFPGKDVSVARSTVETIILLGVIAPIGLPQVYGNFGADIANVVVSQIGRAHV